MGEALAWALGSEHFRQPLSTAGASTAYADYYAED